MIDKNIPREFPIEDSSSVSFEVSNIFSEEYLNVDNNPILLLQPKVVTDLLFKIMNDLKNNNFRVSKKHLLSPQAIKENQLKMDFWEKDVLSTDKNILNKVYKTSYFLKNRNKGLMKKALEFLKLYKYSTYTFVNSEGVTLTTSGGLIKDWHFIEKTGYFQVDISLYWADMIVRLPEEKWNNLRNDITQSITDIKHRFFIIWLIRLKISVGTPISWIKIAKRYNLNYTTKNDVIRFFLLPIKTILDNKEINNNWISFAYHNVEGNDELIRIVPYDVRPQVFSKMNYEGKIIVEDNNKERTRNEVTYQKKYTKRRHKIKSEKEWKLFRETVIEKDVWDFKIKYKKWLVKIRKDKKI